MDVREQFAQVVKELAQFRRDVGVARQQVNEPEVRQLLDELLPKFDEAVAGMEETFPKAMAKIDQDVAGCERGNEEMEQFLREERRKLEDPVIQPVAAVAVGGLAAGYSATLRAEVLERFGERAPAVPAPALSDSVASAWTDPAASIAGENSIALDSDWSPPAPVPPRKPERSHDGKDAWEGLSQVED